jgi:hypothetical protein
MQQQQRDDYDLLAVFPDQAAASTAREKLEKAGYGSGEVFQLMSDAMGKGEFREHGPNRNRSNIFLQTQRTRPTVMLVILFAVAFGIVFGGVGYALPFVLIAIHLLKVAIFPATTGALDIGGLGVVVGAGVGLLQRGRERGNIGQDVAKVNAAKAEPVKGAQNVIALRFPDTENVSRMSRARAILLNSGGKIDRSVHRNE